MGDGETVWERRRNWMSERPLLGPELPAPRPPARPTPPGRGLPASAGGPACGPGYVYVMECDGIYKIGWSRTPRQRLTSIQMSNPHEVTLIGVVEGSMVDEARWHRFFRDKHVRREWFALDARDVSFVLQEISGNDYLPEDDAFDQMPDYESCVD